MKYNTHCYLYFYVYIYCATIKWKTYIKWILLMFFLFINWMNLWKLMTVLCISNWQVCAALCCTTIRHNSLFCFLCYLIWTWKNHKVYKDKGQKGNNTWKFLISHSLNSYQIWKKCENMLIFSISHYWIWNILTLSGFKKNWWVFTHILHLHVSETSLLQPDEIVNSKHCAGGKDSFTLFQIF